MKLNTTTKILFTLFLSVVTSSCEKNYLEYSQHIKSPDGKFNYCLYLDNVGIGDDPGYYILKLNKSINPEKLYIKWSSDNGVKAEDSEWLRNKQILFNYDEAGFLTSNPKLEIINNRHLVFSRGGYYFGLYDIKTEKDTFNIGSPWNEWKNKSNYKSEKYDRDKEEVEYRSWLKQNIDRKIRNYIESNK
jgi:hypothetical protein